MELNKSIPKRSHIEVVKKNEQKWNSVRKIGKMHSSDPRRYVSFKYH